MEGPLQRKKPEASDLFLKNDDSWEEAQHFELDAGAMLLKWSKSKGSSEGAGEISVDGLKVKVLSPPSCFKLAVGDTELVLRASSYGEARKWTTALSSSQGQSAARADIATRRPLSPLSAESSSSSPTSPKAPEEGAGGSVEAEGDSAKTVQESKRDQVEVRRKNDEEEAAAAAAAAVAAAEAEAAAAKEKEKEREREREREREKEKVRKREKEKEAEAARALSPRAGARGETLSARDRLREKVGSPPRDTGSGKEELRPTRDDRRSDTPPEPRRPMSPPRGHEVKKSPTPTAKKAPVPTVKKSPSREYDRKSDADDTTDDGRDGPPAWQLLLQHTFAAFMKLELNMRLGIVGALLVAVLLVVNPFGRSGGRAAGGYYDSSGTYVARTAGAGAYYFEDEVAHQPWLGTAAKFGLISLLLSGALGTIGWHMYQEASAVLAQHPGVSGQVSGGGASACAVQDQRVGQWPAAGTRARGKLQGGATGLFARQQSQRGGASLLARSLPTVLPSSSALLRA